MSFYKFGDNSNKDMAIEVDNRNIYNKIQLLYNIKDADMELFIKKLIRNPNEFKRVRDMFEISEQELIINFIQMFPYIFNSHLVKYIKKTYM